MHEVQSDRCFRLYEFFVVSVVFLSIAGYVILGAFRMNRCPRSHWRLRCNRVDNVIQESYPLSVEKLMMTVCLLPMILSQHHC